MYSPMRQEMPVHDMTSQSDVEHSPHFSGQEDSAYDAAKERSLAPPYPAGDGRHHTRLMVSLGLMFVTGCISPLVLRFVLTYVGHYPVSISVAAPSAIFGVFSIVGYLQRSWSLWKPRSTTRPIGGSPWEYFQLNFTFGIIFVTAVITAANSMKPPKMDVAALPLCILLIQVGAQLLLVQILAACHVQYPCRISSMPGHSGVLRPALYTIIEDIVAVEGKQGTAYRVAFDERYRNSPALRKLLADLSWLWGSTSLVVAAICFALIFSLENTDKGWVIGWSVPWVYAAIMTVPTYFMCKAARD